VATGRDWGRISRIAATAGFAASAVLHLATFTPLPPDRAAAVALVLFAGAFALLAALIVRLREAGAPARGRGAIRMLEWRTLLVLIPEGPRRAAMGVIAYVLLNLVLSLLLLGGDGQIGHYDTPPTAASAICGSSRATHSGVSSWK